MRLRYREQDGVILGLGAALQDAELLAAIESGGGDQFEEMSLAHVVRAGATHQDSARL